MTGRRGNPPDSPWRSTPNALRGKLTGRKPHEMQIAPARLNKLRRIGEALGGGVPVALEAVIDAFPEPPETPTATPPAAPPPR